MKSDSRDHMGNYVALIFSIFIIFAVGAFSDGNASLNNYRELSYSSISPSGERGGSIVPASCESNVIHGWFDVATQQMMVSCNYTVNGPVCDPSNGQACNSTGNACGQTQANGTTQCDGSCSSTPPDNPSGYGNSCTNSNSCGDQGGGGNIQCNGTCSGSVPPERDYYLKPCTSSPNSCGLRNFGTTLCDTSCSAKFGPPESACQNLNSTTNGLTLTANPKFTGPGGFTDLTWTGGGICALYDPNGEIIASSTSGTLRIGPITKSGRYVLSCGGQNATVTVAPSTSFIEF